MIRQFTLNSWEEYEEHLLMLDAFCTHRNTDSDWSQCSPRIYRGHADSGWRLSSTLDRTNWSKNLREYLGKISAIIDNETRERFGTDLPSLDNVETFLRRCHILSPSAAFDKNNQIFEPNLPIDSWIKWMAHLRHHGYPTPLMDWSFDPDVAAYFAFAGSEGSHGYTSIFVNIADAGRGVVSSSNGTMARVTIEAPDFPDRHRNQKSIYTISIKSACTSDKLEYEFITPEEVAMLAWRNAYTSEGKVAFPYEQLHPFDRLPLDNLIWRFDIPKSEKTKVLNILAERGVTTSTLMGDSTDAYVKDLLLLKY